MNGYYFAHNPNYEKYVGGLEWSILEWNGYLLAPGNEIPMDIKMYDKFIRIELPSNKMSEFNNYLKTKV